MKVSHWLFFFIVALGMGYAAVFRYSPPLDRGLIDSAQYFEVTEKGVGAGMGHWKYRILVPALARPIRSWLFTTTKRPESTAAAVLVVNASFVATTAFVVCLLGISIGLESPVAVTAGFVWLCSFPVVNYQLAGLVDSVEALAVSLTLLAGMTGRWYLLVALPLLALGKETAVPLSVAVAVSFIAYRFIRHRRYARAASWTAGAVLFGLGAVGFAHWLADGSWVGPISLSKQMHRSSGLLGSLGRCVVNRGVLYVFAALLPVGLAGRRNIPVALWAAGGFSAACALALGVWNDSGVNVVRAIFSGIGPVLALAAASWLCRRAQPDGLMRAGSD